MMSPNIDEEYYSLTDDVKQRVIKRLEIVAGKTLDVVISEDNAELLASLIFQQTHPIRMLGALSALGCGDLQSLAVSGFFDLRDATLEKLRANLGKRVSFSPIEEIRGVPRSYITFHDVEHNVTLTRFAFGNCPWWDPDTIVMAHDGLLLWVSSEDLAADKENHKGIDYTIVGDVHHIRGTKMLYDQQNKLTVNPVTLNAYGVFNVRGDTE